MKLDSFKTTALDQSQMENVIGGTDIFGEDIGFIGEEDGGFLVGIIEDDILV